MVEILLAIAAISRRKYIAMFLYWPIPLIGCYTLGATVN